MAQSVFANPALAVPPSEAARADALCVHCGLPCLTTPLTKAGKHFCCIGCQTVYEILTENGLGHFYELSQNAGVRIKREARREQFLFLDEPAVREKLLDFSNGSIGRVTFTIPTIHCIACVWLLENLFQLDPGIGRSTVNFPRREVAIQFHEDKISLSRLVTLLSVLGYEPTLSFGALEGRPRKNTAGRQLILRLGIAGFSFGNIMLISFSLYAGLDSWSTVQFKPMFGWVSLILALPVVVYSAADYWRAAWLCLRQRVLTIELPIAAGIMVILAQSVFEVVSGAGPGFFDSLCGLIFFLLIGRWFQQKTYDRLSFDLDYKSFFPLSVIRIGSDGEETVPLSALAVGDRLRLRHGELIPADSQIIGGRGVIDYSFVTGESEPVEKAAGEIVFAGGQQAGGLLEVQIVKPVSQSYLTSLWGHVAFAKQRINALDTILNRFARHFTIGVSVVAVVAGLWWWWLGQPSLALKAFTSVLIVACPCALALSAPFALGTAQRLLGRRNIFIKSPQVVETLARVDAVVFDKTGTLTTAGRSQVAFHGIPLADEEERWLCSVARHSAHPLAVRIERAATRGQNPLQVQSFNEVRGQGIEAEVDGHRVLLGSASWLESRGIGLPRAPLVPTTAPEAGSVVHLAFDGLHRGVFTIASMLRPEADTLITRLSADYELALLSGDNTRERERFRALFGNGAQLHFNQSPQNKLGFIQGLQQSNRIVLMAGDGLNDAGALRQSDAGVAVVERIGTFSPASDVIIEADQVPRLADLLRFSKTTVRVVWLGILLSTIYNVVGLGIAASGRLSPVISAVLMPLSSISVVAFACGATRWAARRAGIGGAGPVRGGDR